VAILGKFWDFFGGYFEAFLGHFWRFWGTQSPGMGSEDLASSAEINVPKTIVAWNSVSGEE
jgi:hypothetical protein